MHRIGRLEDYDGFNNPGILQENKNEETIKRMSFMYHMQTPFWYPDIIVQLKDFLLFIGIIKPLQTLPPVPLARL